MQKLINKSIRPFLITCLLFCFLVYLGSSAIAITKTATWTTKGDFESNASTTGSATVITGLEVTGINLASDTDIALDSLMGNSFPVSTAKGAQWVPKIAYNSKDNEFVVTWEDWGNDSGPDIYAQRVDANGSLLGTPIPIDTDYFSQWNPSIAYNSKDNQYMISWVKYRTFRDANGGFFSTTDIYVQRLDASGNLLGSSRRVSKEYSDQWEPTIAYNSKINQYIIAWTDTRNYGDRDSNVDIFAQIVDASGNLVGTNSDTNIPVSIAPDAQDIPQIAYNSTGNQYLIVWNDIRTGNYPYDVYAQIIDADGNLVGTNAQTNFKIADGSNDYRRYPQVAYNQVDDEFMIVWSNKGIYTQRVASNGILAGTSKIVSISGGRPVIAHNRFNNQFMIAWVVTRNPILELDIYQQKIKGDGSLVGTSAITNSAVFTGSEAQRDPSIAYNSADNQFMIIWVDRRNNDLGLFGQRLNASFSGQGMISNLKLNVPENFRKWSTIAWNGNIPAGTAIKFRTRSADTEQGLVSSVWSNYYASSGSQITSEASKWLEIEATLESADGLNSPVLNDFTINYDLNSAPVLSSVGNKTVDEGQLLEFNLSATDLDGDSLLYTASNLPVGTLFNQATRTFSWTPDYAQAGSYSNVRFEVSDGSLKDSEDITITVNNVEQESQPQDPGGNNPDDQQPSGGQDTGGQQPGGQPGGGAPTTPTPAPQQSILGTKLSLKATPSSIIAGKVAKLIGQLKGTNGQAVTGKTVAIKAKVTSNSRKKKRSIYKKRYLQYKSLYGKTKNKKLKNRYKKLAAKYKRAFRKLKVTFWKTIARVKTNSKGQFIKALRPRTTTIYKAEFSGDTQYKKANSNTVKVTINNAKKKKKKR